MSSTNSDREPIVWIVNEGGHTYSKAEKFGRLIALTTGSMNPFAIDRLLVNISQRLTMAQEEDFVLISGLPIVNALVIAFWLTKFPKAKLLQWSVDHEKYTKLVLWRSTLEAHKNGKEPAA